MFVANHNSWMDIPFVGVTLGWSNYKLISKAELGKVPILGKAIRLGGHVMVDRSNRKSQLLTFKAGMQWLKVREIYSFEIYFLTNGIQMNTHVAMIKQGWSSSCGFSRGN